MHLSQPIDIEIGLGQGNLIRVQRGKGLQLDELRLQFTVCASHQAEVYLHEHRMQRFVWNIEFFRYRLVRAGTVFGPDQLPYQFLASERQLVQHSFWEKAGRLAKTERNLSSAHLINAPEKLP